MGASEGWPVCERQRKGEEVKGTTTMKTKVDYESMARILGAATMIVPSSLIDDWDTWGIAGPQYISWHDDVTGERYARGEGPG
jgi:hypothetical protein